MARKLLFLIFTVAISVPFIAKAGFGVTPPYISNNHLIPGSYFEETIYLVRSSPDTEEVAEVTIGASEIEDWIVVNDEIVLPKDFQQTSLKIGISIPQDVESGSYEGNIRIKGEGTPGNFGGVRVDISLTVAREDYSDFRVVGVDISDFEKKDPLITVLITIENIGNVKARPSRVHLDIYDVSHKNLLISGDLGNTEWVEAFKTSQVRGSMPIDLEWGDYWADVSIYKKGKSLGINNVYFSVIGTEKEEVVVEETVRIEETKGPSLIEIIFIILLSFLR